MIDFISVEKSLFKLVLFNKKFYNLYPEIIAYLTQLSFLLQKQSTKHEDRENITSLMRPYQIASSTLKNKGATSNLKRF